MAERVFEDLLEDFADRRSDGLEYVRIKDIPSFLSLLQAKLEVVLNDSKIWDITNSFIDTYPKMLIRADLFKSFLDDLYQLDFISLVESKINVENESIDVFNSVPIKEEQEIEKEIEKEVEEIEKIEKLSKFNELQKTIDEKIEAYNKNYENTAFESVIKSEPEQIKDIIESEPIKIELTDVETVAPTVSTTTSIEAEVEPEVKPQKQEIISKTEIKSSLPIWFFLILCLNISLLILLIFILLIITNSEIRQNLLKFLLREDVNDIYWWQKVPYLEKYAWEILDFIRSYDNNRM